MPLRIFSFFLNGVTIHPGFPGSSAGKESACNAGDPGSVPGLGRSPGEGMDTHSSILGLPWWLRWERIACNSGDLGSIPGSGRSPGGGHGNPLQYSCLENPTDSRAWRATVYGVTKSRTRLSN